MSTSAISYASEAVRSANATTSAHGSRPQPRSNYFDIEEWIKMEVEKEAQGATGSNQKPKMGMSMVEPRKAATAASNSKTTQASTPSAGIENWVGRLQGLFDRPFCLNWFAEIVSLEFLVSRGPEFSQADFAYTQRLGSTLPFACTLTLNPTLAPHPFPLENDRLGFANKKMAKQHAAKCAVQWLDSQPGIASSATANSQPAAGPSHGAQVSAACARLGLPPPQYVITQNDSFGAFWSGYAHFGSDPRVEGRVGEFRDIYSRKKAKDECARLVLHFLQGMEELRLRLVDEGVGQRRSAGRRGENNEPNDGCEDNRPNGGIEDNKPNDGIEDNKPNYGNDDSKLNNGFDDRPQ